MRAIPALDNSNVSIGSKYEVNVCIRVHASNVYKDLRYIKKCECFTEKYLYGRSFK